MKRRKTVDTKWQVWTYDVQGNRQDGYEINGRRWCHSRRLRLRIHHYNAGTERAFDGAHIADYQLQQVFGVQCKLDVTGDDVTYYVQRASDWYPIGEMRCVSHDSLSPIRAVVETDSTKETGK